ncbi:MAG: 3-deoxy-D-manno-octulosonic acid transferase [Muribaculaceae bacterium]|nr:3-deoxy-D-manno-octulosonic acid transferase [Muribaculaceae bacterium]
MNLLYQVAINTYSGAVKVASIWHKKARKMVAGQRETLSRLADLNRRPEVARATDRIWFHAASLGEFEQGRPLIEMIRSTRPDAVIILSFFSPSGMEVRKDYDKVDMTVYLPFDTRENAREFIEAMNPSMAFFIKYEFWGNILNELKNRDIPTYLISGIFRPDQHFFKSWGGQFRQMLGCFTRLYVQNESSRKLLEDIGINNVVVNGDTRLDRVYQIMQNAEGDPVLELFSRPADHKTDDDPRLLIAGSTWPADEVLLLDWLKRHSEYRAIIAPHEMDRHRLESLSVDLGEGTWLLSELRQYHAKHGALPHGIQYVIIDCYGLLAAIYRYGSLAYIGGGFGAGIHNINEAAVYGLPVVFGPNYHKFQEAVDLIRRGGGFSIASKREINAVFDRLTTDAAERAKAGKIAADYIAGSRGATKRVFDDIFSSPDKNALS